MVINKISFLTLGAALTMSSVTFADRSSNVPLEPIQVEPGQTVTLPLDKLYDGVTYYLSCKFDIKGSKSKYSNIQVFCPLTSFIRKAGDSYDIKCATKGNILSYATTGDGLAIYFVVKDSSIQFRNLDYTDPVTFNCIGIL